MKIETFILKLLDRHCTISKNQYGIYEVFYNHLSNRLRFIIVEDNEQHYIIRVKNLMIIDF